MSRSFLQDSQTKARTNHYRYVGEMEVCGPLHPSTHQINIFENGDKGPAWILSLCCGPIWGAITASSRFNPGSTMLKRQLLLLGEEVGRGWVRQYRSDSGKQQNGDVCVARWRFLEIWRGLSLKQWDSSQALSWGGGRKPEMYLWSCGRSNSA